MERQHEYVLRTVEERGIRFVQLVVHRRAGRAEGLRHHPAELENALQEGMTFDGSAHRRTEPRPGERTCWPGRTRRRSRSCPCRAAGEPTARVFCDITDLDGAPHGGDPRNVLRRNLDRAKERGFTFYAAPEVEWFYFADDDPAGPPRPLDRGGYFDLTVADLATDMRRQTVLTLEDMGVPVEYSQHEDAPSQHEIDLRHTDALTMADTLMTLRLIVKEIAMAHGAYATFMPKPVAGVQGSGMHTHFSLFEGDVNAFHDPGDPHELSKVAKGFIAGLLHHAPEITAVTNQWVNSYKRLVVGYEAPVHVAWARNNGSAVVNVPHSKRGRAESTRIEYRAPDPACNPYLAFAVGARRRPRRHRGGLRAAGRDDRQPPPHVHVGPRDGRHPLAAGQPQRRHRRDGALRAGGRRARQPRVRVVHPQQALEWSEYKTQVSQFELERYLPAL
jgi:glutamine synthetase